MEHVQHRNEAPTRRANALHTLDSLAELDVTALGRIYEEGTVPSTPAPLDGHPRGRMLAVRMLDSGPVASALRAFSGAAGFPWEGKTFAGGKSGTGTGINRVSILGRHQLFPFRTRIAPSAIDGRSTIVLDYDLSDNPSLIRKIHDEVREVSPGLYLGPAMWKTAAGPKLVLWFALDTHTQARPIGG